MRASFEEGLRKEEEEEEEAGIGVAVAAAAAGGVVVVVAVTMRRDPSGVLAVRCPLGPRLAASPGGALGPRYLVFSPLSFMREGLGRAREGAAKRRTAREE